MLLTTDVNYNEIFGTRLKRFQWQELAICKQRSWSYHNWKTAFY